MSEQDMIEVKRYLEAERLTREFWATVRAALIMFVRAIEKRYGMGDAKQITIGENDSVAGATKG
jgi:hypothetical protein